MGLTIPTLVISYQIAFNGARQASKCGMKYANLATA